MAINILIDSSSEFTEEELQEANIECIPITIIFGNQEYFDGVTLSKDMFYHRLLVNHEFPQTSQPSPEKFLKFFQKVKKQGDSVIAILLSGALSGTVQCAHIAKKMSEYNNIYIIDSLSATGGIKILVKEAVRLRDQGYSTDEIVEALLKLRHKIRIFAAVDTLEYLHKGGRLSRTQAIVGTLANIKPIITVTPEGKVAVCSKSIGKNKAISFLIKKIKNHPIDLSYDVYLAYSYNIENCHLLSEKMAKHNIQISIPQNNIINIGPTIGAHVGSGAFGIIYIEKE